MGGNERFMPPGYAEKLQAARRERAMRGERRIITMLFCDVVGSTAMAGQLDPEEWAEIMNEAFEYLITPIYRYEGTVARLLGDAILAFFGAPIAHEDDPQRAILAGLSIVEGIQGFAAGIKADYGLDFNVRVGINTGPVVVGEVGTDLALEYTAMGDAINVASRMEDTAEPGTVQITEDTFRLVAPLFEVHDRGAIHVKGKEEPVQAYQVSGLRSQPGKLRGIRGRQAPLIGRERPFAALQQVVEELLQTDKGQIVCLTGEAGVGKSRLLDELQAYFAADILAERLGWIEGRGISYDTARPYGVIMQMFRQISGVRPDDAPQAARAKIRGQIQSFSSGPRTSMTQALEILLALTDGGDVPGPEGEALQQQLFKAFHATWRQTTANIPLVSVHDDMQWADPASIELLLHLWQLVDSTPSVFICSFRPQRESPARRLEEAATSEHDAYYTPLHLRSLSAEESALLLQNLLGEVEVPQELTARILQRAEGNPFFMEEVVRGLLESGNLVQEGNQLRWQDEGNEARMEIPSHVHSLLVARIDRLDKETKQVAQLAAVIGRSFYERVLAQIVDPRLDLAQHLHELVQMRLIQGEAGAQEKAYVFRQAMARDAAYQSLLHRQRRRTHRRVGEAMEMLFADRLAEEAHQLAYHFYEARQWQKALHYYRLAGDQAARLYANQEAIEQYSRALELALQQDAEEDIITLYLARGRTYEFSGRYDEALADYRELQALGIEQDKADIRLEALLAETALRSSYSDQYDPQQGRERLEQALALAKAVDNRRAQAKLYWNLLLQGRFGLDDPQQVVAYGEKAVAIARAGDFREELAYALHDLARPYMAVGRIDQAARGLEEAGVLWRELGKLPMLVDTQATLASGYWLLGQLDEAVVLAQEALALSQRIGTLWGEAYSLNILGPIYLELGRVDEALAAWRQAVPLAHEARFIGAQSLIRTFSALTYGYIGETEKGWALLQEALEATRLISQSDLGFISPLAEARLHLYDSDVRQAAKVLEEPEAQSDWVRTDSNTGLLFATVEALVGFAEGRYEVILGRLERAIARAEQMGLVIWLIELWLLQGGAYLGLERVDEATAVLTKAQAAAEKSGSRKLLWQVLGALADIAAQEDEEERANELRQAMEVEIAYVAGHIADEQLRRTFLARARSWRINNRYKDR